MDAKGRKEDVKAAARKSRRTDKENMNKNKQEWGGRRGSTHGSWTGASGKQRTQSGTSGKEARDWNIRARYGSECSGQHQGEEAAAARRKGEESTNKSKMRRRATAEAGTGLRQREGMEERGEGGGAAPRRRGGDSGDRTRRGRKGERRSTGERSQLRSNPAARRPVTRAVVVGSIPTSSARGAHLKTSIVPGLGRRNSCNRS